MSEINWGQLEESARQVVAPREETFSLDSIMRSFEPKVKDPNCGKCRGKGYTDLPESQTNPDPAYADRPVEYSVCSQCGGFIYQTARSYKSHTSLPERDYTPRWPGQEPVPVAGTPDAPRAGLAQPVVTEDAMTRSRKLWREAEEHAAQAEQAILLDHLNGY